MPSTPRAFTSGGRRVRRGALHGGVRGPAGAGEGACHLAGRLGRRVPAGRRARAGCGWWAVGRWTSRCGRKRRRWGLAEQVEFLGHRDRVEEVLAEADVGVLPRASRGSRTRCSNSWLADLPSLASRVSGSEDFVVPGRNGWLFEVSDVPALAAACARRRHFRPKGWPRWGGTRGPTWKRSPRSTSWWGDCWRSMAGPTRVIILNLRLNLRSPAAPPYIDN